MTDHATPHPSHTELLTVAEAAEVLRLSPRTVERLVAARALPVVRFSRSVRIRRTDLDQLIAAHLEPAVQVQRTGRTRYQHLAVHGTAGARPQSTGTSSSGPRSSAGSSTARNGRSA